MPILVRNLPVARCNAASRGPNDGIFRQLPARLPLAAVAPWVAAALLWAIALPVAANPVSVTATTARSGTAPVTATTTKAATGAIGATAGGVIDASTPLNGDATSGTEAADGVVPSEQARPGVDPAVLDAFMRARKAMVESDLDRFDQAVRNIPKTHPLQRYVEYWRLRILLSERRPESASGEADGAVRAYIARYPESLVADLLRRDWMLALGRREDWRSFDEQYERWILRDETAPDCYAQLSRLTAGKADRSAALDLVMRPVALSRACRALFTGLADAGLLDKAHYRQRLFLALEANVPADVRDAAALAGLALQAPAIDTALRKPAQTLKGNASADLTLIALVRLIRSDVDQGARRLDALASRLGPAERNFAWSQLAAAGARQMMPEAHGWMVKAHAAQTGPGAATYSDDTRRWLIRSALRHQDWRWVARLIDDFPASTRAEPEFRYWRGRAHAALGQKDKARAEFEAIATRLDYYGKLAREELGRPIAVLPRAQDVAARGEDGNADLSIPWERNESIQRALAFYDVGMRFEGNREWNFAIRAMSPSQMRSVAWWAQQQGLLDRAINTDERLGSDAVAELRFPTPHAERLVPIARANGIDPSWAYGLIRQESRFIQSARSTVGASGLMQLMPATAKWVARQLGRQDYGQHQIDDLKTNLEFGTFYLKRVLDNVDGSPLLASAGYNAGPARARTWRSTLERPLEGAIFAELIPFTETRNYVKHVLSNTVDYAALASGQPQSLKRWLGNVSPAANETVAMP